MRAKNAIHLSTRGGLIRSLWTHQTVVLLLNYTYLEDTVRLKSSTKIVPVIRTNPFAACVWEMPWKTGLALENVLQKYETGTCGTLCSDFVIVLITNNTRQNPSTVGEAYAYLARILV
jgi:hypothetical protein